MSGVQGIRDPITEALSTQYQLIGSRRVAETIWREQGLEEQLSLGAFTAGISVEPQRGSHLVRIGYLSADRERAAQVANGLVDAYMQDSRQRALGITDAGLKKLNTKATELRAEVERRAEELARFRRDHPDLPLDGNATIASTRLNSLNAELISAEAERISAQSEFQALELAGAEAAGSDRFHELRLEVARVLAERAELLRLLRPNHPVIRELEHKLAEAQARIAQAHSLNLVSLRSRVRAAEERERRLRAEVDRLSGNLEQQARDTVAYRFMSQSHEACSASYQGVVRRIEEIELAESTAARDANVYWVERAEVPGRPVVPDVRKNMSFAAIFGLVAGVALCFLIELLDRSIKSKAEVEALLGFPVIGHVPAIQVVDATAPPELQPARATRSAAAEAFRTIRLGISFGIPQRERGRARRVMLTSSVPRDGKTLCSVNVAVAFARQGKRTLLIDCDLRKPRVHSVFGMTNNRGLSSLLAGEDPLSAFDDVVRPTETSNLSVLSSGPLPPNPADLLHDERMGEILRLCDDRFDWIVFDAPPAALPDPLILSAYVRDVVFVVRSFVTPKDLARQACEQLGKIDARMLGVILNDANAPRGTSNAYESTYYEYGARGRSTEATQPLAEQAPVVRGAPGVTTLQPEA